MEMGFVRPFTNMHLGAGKLRVGDVAGHYTKVTLPNRQYGLWFGVSGGRIYGLCFTTPLDQFARTESMFIGKFAFLAGPTGIAIHAA